MGVVGQPSPLLVTMFLLRYFTEATKCVGLLRGFKYFALTVGLISYDVSDHHHVPEGLGVLSCSLILKMKLVPPPLSWSFRVPSSFPSIL